MGATISLLKFLLYLVNASNSIASDNNLSGICIGKMEELQQRRAEEWAHDMDKMTAERKRLAFFLTEALQRLENISGVFLIKPVVSFKGKGPTMK